MQSKIAIYPGSFDPPTYGHMNIVERGLGIFQKIIIAVARNTSKKSLLTPEERVELLKKIFQGRRDVEIDQFEGLLVDYAKKKKTNVILRGLRTVADYEYELQMSFSNKSLSPNIETIFMMTESKFSHISSTIIKEIAYFRGSVKGMVHPLVEKTIRNKNRRG
ncbi:MAG TPA: pantetheine-phosphate adenylyltransferase [Deltaproteobacteria bacterium]|nr:pantetheine-phosphate adenylyltransferase [Deltaproteobacteria bacterium]